MAKAAGAAAFGWLVAALALPAAALSALIILFPPTFAIFNLPVKIVIPSTAATIDLKPESMQNVNNGQPVTGFIEFPAGSGLDPANIKVSTVLLCRGSSRCVTGVAAQSPKVGDNNGNGIVDLKVSFDRGPIIAMISDVVPTVDVTFAVSGTVSPPGVDFLGTDVIKITPG